MNAVTDPAERSLGDLVKFVTEDLSHLVRSEIKLAQVEVTEKAKAWVLVLELSEPPAYSRYLV